MGAHHHRQEFEIPSQGALEERQFYFEGVLLVVSHPGQSVPKNFLEMSIQLRDGCIIHRDLTQRGGVSGMGGGEQRLVIGLVHWREHSHQVRGHSAYGCKSISGDRPGVDVPGMWSNDGHHLAGELRQLGLIKVLIDCAGKGSGVAFIPRSCQRRWTNRCDCCHMGLLVRCYFSTEGGYFIFY